MANCQDIEGVDKANGQVCKIIARQGNSPHISFNFIIFSKLHKKISNKNSKSSKPAQAQATDQIDYLVASPT